VGRHGRTIRYPSHGDTIARGFPHNASHGEPTMNTKAPTYDWRCRNCDAVNVAHTSVCAACGFDTIYCYSPSVWAQMESAGVPAWRRVVILLLSGVGAVVGFVGFFLFTWVYFLTDAVGMAWSGLATLIGVGLFSIAQKLYPEDA
jgi:ribosomal protein L37E